MKNKSASKSASTKKQASPGRGRRLGLVLVVVLVVAALILGAIGYRLPGRSFPQVSGEISLPGLDAEVEVRRDGFGVPHIYAQTPHDLFFAQGYVQAQDRFYQMDFWRHTGAGRLSEMFGESQLENDIFLRTLGFDLIVEQEFALMDAATQAVLEAYAEGVNAYLADHKGAALSLEYAILHLNDPDYEPEPWRPTHTLIWAKVMAYELGGNMRQEVQLARLLDRFNIEKLSDLYPPYPEDMPVIAPEYRMPSMITTQAPLELETSLVGLSLDGLEQQLAQMEALFGLSGAEIGSNNWVISGERTASGMPILANDPHLSAQMPSIWYENGLHCEPFSVDCPFDVVGFSFAGAPGIIVGHNKNIAWGVTNVGPDVQDLFVLRLNPDNPNQYELDGQWMDLTLRTETIQVASGDAVNITVRMSRFGPVIWDNADWRKSFREESALDLPESYALALRWTALQPDLIYKSFLDINKARNFADFRVALFSYGAPSQNFIYADGEGNIAYIMPGNIPLRNEGTGALPTPGWSASYDWEGYLPFELLPYAFNPKAGYIATANNAVVGSDYPFFISLNFDYGYRAQRIVEMIENAPGPIDLAYIRQMQGDNENLSARFILPVLGTMPQGEAKAEAARQLLLSWDGQMHMDSPAAALYAVFWKRLLDDTFVDELAQSMTIDGGSRWFEVMRQLVQKPENAWWDDVNTPAKETMQDAFQGALEESIAELESQQGKNPDKWNWGDLHTLTFENQSLGRSGIGLVEGLFNRGPYRTSGGGSIVNATGYDPRDFQVRSLPSLRMIVDFSDLSASLAVHTTGQSGHAYHPHYDDLVDLWRLIEYHPMLWERADVEAASLDVLRLIP